MRFTADLGGICFRSRGSGISSRGGSRISGSGTVSGGVTVNDTLLHIGHEGLPFGGVGDSGWGAYHGETGFLRFTHPKSVLLQSRWAAGHLLYPPYGERFARVMGLIRRLL